MPSPNDEKETLVSAKIDTKSLACLYTMFYKRGMNPRAQLIFAHNGDKDSAIKRGREHCLRMNFKFIHVEPFLVDLDETEKQFQGVGRL
jgi:hypothetical protein